ncbi:transposase family protein [Streptomyces yerevanensis]|uniref:transposase family protein n=1 Tax=Streptomyces yerevanensis TaxID=66378 RepID=UPI000A849911|nr:transposase family protein [Streptomyces yerevanensis]
MARSTVGTCSPKPAGTSPWCCAAAAASRAWTSGSSTPRWPRTVRTSPSPASRGRSPQYRLYTSEITACRHDRLTARLRATGLGAIADLGFVGLDDSGPDADPAVITGYKAARNRPLTRGQKLSNKALAAVRAPVEHGFAHLKNWRVLGKVRTDSKWATALVRALLVLTNREVSR